MICGKCIYDIHPPFYSYIHLDTRTVIINGFSSFSLMTIQNALYNGGLYDERMRNYWNYMPFAM